MTSSFRCSVFAAVLFVSSVALGQVPQAPAQTPSPAQMPVRVGGTIKAPIRIKDVKPVYPQIAQSARVQGVVIIEAVIAPDGKVADAKIVRSIPLLDQAALDAVRQWEYTPTLINGVAIPVIMTVTVNFTLQDATHSIALTSERVVIECDDTGKWTRIYALESEPAVVSDQGSVAAAHQAATMRATNNIALFFESQSPSEALSSEIELAEANAPAGSGPAKRKLSPEARARLVAAILQAREIHSRGVLPGQHILQRGVDPVKALAWARVGVSNVPLPAGAVSGGISGGIVGALPQAPPPPGVTQAPLRVGGNIKAPERTKYVKPFYPPEAQSAGVTGTVIIEAIIGPDGRVADARILRSIPQLDQSALDAVRQWEWLPTLLNGVAVPVIMTVTVSFSLQ